MINGIHHVALSTPDLDRLAKFYRDVFGFKAVDWVGGWSKGSDLIDEIVGLRGSAARQTMLRTYDFETYRSTNASKCRMRLS